VGLGRFVLRRLATFAPTILGVLFLTYIIAYAIPTNPVRAWVSERIRDVQRLEALKEKYKFNAPWWEQFSFLVTSLLTGSLEDPVREGSVFQRLGQRFPVTVEVAIYGMIFILIIGIPLGILAALFKDSLIDFFVRFLALFGGSMPSFVLYFFLIYVFFNMLGWTTLAGIPEVSDSCAAYIAGIPQSVAWLPQAVPILGHIAYYLAEAVRYIGGVPIFGAAMCGEWDIITATTRRLWLPGLALGLLSGGFIARIIRNSLLDALSSEYVLFAKARGLRKLTVWKHAIKNALIPVVTVLGLQFGGLLAGAVIAETVFNIPGMGRYIYEQIVRLNFPVILAGTFIFAIIYVTANLIVDILYALIDPRVRY
jgi:peptide/nickel transport system permease protein